MGAEGLGEKKTGLTPGEKTYIDRVQRDADPTTYSSLPLKDEVVKIGSAKSVGESDIHSNAVVVSKGERYYRIKQNAGLQQVISRMLKGIINVSDVVSHGEHKKFLGVSLQKPALFSKRMRLERVENETSVDQDLADIELLRLIFLDIDHDFDYQESNNIHTGNTYIGKVAYHDFGISQMMTPIRNDEYFGFYSGLKLGVARALQEKIVLCKERFFGEDGKRFVKAIYESAEKTMGKKFPVAFEIFYAELLERIEKTEDQVHEFLTKQQD